MKWPAIFLLKNEWLVYAHSDDEFVLTNGFQIEISGIVSL